MSYLNEEQSVESGRPIELYLFTLGADEQRYTSAAESITVLGETWTPLPIERTSIKASRNDRSAKIDIAVPGDETFVQNFASGAPSEMPTVAIWRLHFGDSTDVVKLWNGEVVELTWVDDSAICKISTRPIEGAFDARIPRFDAGTVCPYMLYDADCGVAEASHQYVGTVSSPSGAEITVSGVDTGLGGVGKANAGKVRLSNGEVRVVLQHTATDTLELGSPFNEDPTGLSCTVFKGCEHTAAYCDSEFSNLINYGGRPEAPIKDPWTTGVN